MTSTISISKITPIVGLEIHVELATQTKMFCRCINRFGDEPNTHVCPVCTAMPGSLPVMNRQAVEYSIKVGLALGCTVPEYTKWDRKNYYYPDLPKNYQISQYDLPLAEHGVLEIPLESGEVKAIRVLRAHLEEDAGKNTHDLPGCTGVDLNRAGVPLLEIVSEPDMNSVEEVLGYARSMHRLVRWLGVSEANMQMGHMRFEPNINLHIDAGGQTYKTPIVEVKNLNSFRALERAVAYEIKRQTGEWQADPEGFCLKKLGKQNRGYDDNTEKTVFQREKEEAHDYRYFPDPDLPAVVVDEAWRESIRSEIGELPLARRQRYMDEYNLAFQEADALTMDAPTSDLFDNAVESGADPKRAANLMLGRAAPELAMAASGDMTETYLQIESKPLEFTIKPLVEIVDMTTKGKISASSAEKIFLTVIQDKGGKPAEIAEAQGLLQVSDTGQLEAWVDEALAENADAVAKAREGDKKVVGFLMGQVMQKSRGAANPGQASKLLQQKLNG